MSYAHAFSCICTLYSIYFCIFELFGAFLIVSFFPLSVWNCLERQWHRNIDLLRPGTVFVLGHRLLLILPPLLFDSVMRMPERTSWRTFLDEVFIQNAESFCQILPTLTYPMSFTIGVGSHCVTSRSHVLLCKSKSFTPTCMDLILQYLPFILAFDVHV